MSSSLPHCDIGNSTHYVTDWSNCTLGDCIYQNKYRIPYVGCCSDGSGNFSSTASVLRRCWIQTSDIELSPCDTGTWDCTETAQDYLTYLRSWTPWQVEWCKPESLNKTTTFRVGWRVRPFSSIQRVTFFEEQMQTCPTVEPETQFDYVWLYGIFFMLVWVSCVGYRLSPQVRNKLKEACRCCLATGRRLQRKLQRGHQRRRLSLSSISDTSSGGGSSVTLQNITINTTSLPPTYYEIILSDNGDLAYVPRTTSTTIPTSTTQVNPIFLSSANAIGDGIPPPSYDMLFETGARPVYLLENERPPSYSKLSRPVNVPKFRQRCYSNASYSFSGQMDTADFMLF